MNDADPVITSGSRGSWLGVVLLVCVIVGVCLPLLIKLREFASRTQCVNGVKWITLALHNYHDDFGSFPPAYTVDANGSPLHSWRTLLLPYLEQQELYEQIDLSKPWNDPVNAAACKTNLVVFRCPSADASENHTTYMGVSGADAIFSGSQPTRLRDITDGSSSTLMLVEVPTGQSVPWMAPQDADDVWSWLRDGKSKFPHGEGFETATADGSLHFMDSGIKRATLKALITISADDDVGEFFF